MARAFFAEYKDPRYWRWAIFHYRRLSERLFYRRLDMTPETTVELAEGTRNPYALEKKPVDPSRSVLQKYRLIRTEILHGAPVIEKRPLEDEASVGAEAELDRELERELEAEEALEDSAQIEQGQEQARAPATNESVGLD